MTLEQAIPTVECNIGGKVRTLTASMYVLWKYQQETGKNPFELAIKSMTPDDMVTFIWAAMQQDEPEMKKEDAAKMMSGMHLKALGQLINKLFDTGAALSGESNGDSDSGKKKES